MVAADRVAATVIQGVHGRRRVGQGDAFWQYRPYRDGDSASQIDWRQSARSRHLFVRETEWEAAPASGCGAMRRPRCNTPRSEKHRHQGGARRADHLALASLRRCRRARHRAWLGHAPDLGTGSPCADRRRCSTRRAAAEPPPSLPPLLPLPAHGTIVLVSDWLDPLDNIEAVIRHYASGGVPGIWQVLDPAEEDLPFDGHVKFEGLEAKGQHTIQRVKACGRPMARGWRRRRGLQRLTRSTDWTVHLHRTDKSPQTVLLLLYLAMADASADGGVDVMKPPDYPGRALRWRRSSLASTRRHWMARSPRMLSLGAFAFAAPGMLALLLVLPVIYWLLRMIPPLPKLVRFPAIRLLIGLEPTEQTPMKMPWWLLLLRLLLATALDPAVARPLLNPQADLPGRGPLMLVIDDGWSSAPGWTRALPMPSA